MVCLLSCSRDSGEELGKTDFNWPFSRSMITFFLLSFSTFPILFSGATPCASCFLCLMNLQNLLLRSCTASSSFGCTCMLFMYACRVCLCTNPLQCWYAITLLDLLYFLCKIKIRRISKQHDHHDLATGHAIVQQSEAIHSYQQEEGKEAVALI